MEFFDIIPLIQTIGLLGIFLFAFAESGVFFGCFLPGDSLLFTAGVLAAAGYFPVGWLFIGCFIAAVLGDSFGYWFGKKTGPRIFANPNALFLNTRNLERTALFFNKHGSKALVLARFTPIVRTFAPILAGAACMEYRTFVKWNISGAFLWTGLLIYVGYFLGNSVENIDRIILPIVCVIIFVSVIPIFWHLVRERKTK